MEIIPSKPEPLPVSGDLFVTDYLIDHLSKRMTTSGKFSYRTQCYENAIALIRARDAYGKAKYNTRLRTNNGRDFVEDARQEIGDFMQYFYGCLLEGRDVSSLLELLHVVTEMAHSDMVEYY